MRYENVREGIFLKRLNRFTALARIGEEEMPVHVKNTGRLFDLLVPGNEAVLQKIGNPNRKTAFDLIGIRKNGKLYNVDSLAPNEVVHEWLEGQDFDSIRPETAYGSSRIDFSMERGGEPYLLEVKGCTLERNGIGYFPDAPTERGMKHVLELTRAAGDGIHAGIAFVACMKGVSRVLPNDEIQPDFGKALRQAQRAGVAVFVLETDPKVDEIHVTCAHRLSLGNDCK